MSKGSTPPRGVEATATAAVPARLAQRIVAKHGRTLLLVFLSIAVPLWAFGELAEDVVAGRPFWFDVPVLEGLHGLAGPAANRFFLAVSAVGYSGGVVPLDVILVVLLTLKRHPRGAIFATLSIVGSALLNVAAKHVFGRARPALWISIAPESTYSFPSGHAMGSMTLVAVLVALAWPTRARWGVVLAGGIFVLLVGMSRAYLGVHYPSDILAGWAAAVAWVTACGRLTLKSRAAPHSSEKGGASQQNPH